MNKRQHGVVDDKTIENLPYREDENEKNLREAREKIKPWRKRQKKIGRMCAI